MAVTALGTVTNASTTVAVRATTNRTDPTKTYPVQAAAFQALVDNTGIVYICDRANPVVATGVGILWEILASSATYRGSFTVGNPAGAQPINMADLYILPAVGGEGVRVVAVA